MPRIVADREEAPGASRVGTRRPDRVLDAGRADQELVANKSGATRLGFALLLKFFELEARFPRDVSELPWRGSRTGWIAWRSSSSSNRPVAGWSSRRTHA